MRVSLRKKIIILTISLLVFVTFTAGIISALELQKYYKAQIHDQLLTQIDEVSYLLIHTNIAASIAERYKVLVNYVQKSGLRLTLIDSAGVVLFDSNVPRDSLLYVENHLHRPEIQQALAYHLGSDERQSATINQPLYYVAKVFDKPNADDVFLDKVRFVRVAIPLKNVNDNLRQVRLKIFGASGLALLIVSVLSFWIANRLTYPIHNLSQVAESIKAGNSEARFQHHSKDELGELADLLNQMLDKLRKDLVQMRKLERMRSQFLGNVSHELRTPIFSIQGYLETLLNNPECNKKTQRKFVKKAYRQATRLNNLLTDLIDISRIESGEMRLTFTAFDIHAWLQKMFNDLQSTAQENDVSIILEKMSDQNVKVIGDKRRLSQVMTNLVENAVKYNRPGGKVIIGTRDKLKEVEVFVTDTGRGIPEEHLSRIFERFYRVDKERSRSVGGTGLGLAIVKHIIEAHKSKIYVVSQPGKGSTFRFSLRKKL
ncbi:MAG: HAMP domain-containing protein [Actinobacteria bacterium]|nr:HAMP domain-containing protein [Actinomycetota bacterium]